MRFTVNDLKNSRVPAAMGVGPDDPRLIQWLNEATERLLYTGKWWDTVARFRMCATDGCITLPVQIATIEAVNVCGWPTPVRDFWYEFLENGWGSINAPCPNGLCGSTGCMNAAIMRGNFPSFSDIRGTGKKLNFICDLASDVSKTVLALGYDGNGNWIRTTQGGVVKDGEVITLSQSDGAYSVNFFQVLSGVQFSGLDGQVWLYEFDTTIPTNNKRMIGHYQYFETNPSYARYYFPNVFPRNGGTSGSCTLIPVETIGKLAYIPVAQDTDNLIIGNIPALKEMMKAIKRAENEQDSAAANNIILAGMSTAQSILDSQLDHHLGSGRKMGMNVVGSGVGYNDPIPTLI